MKVLLLLLFTVGLLYAKTFEFQEQGLFDLHNRARTDPFFFKEQIANELNTKFTLNEVDKYSICYWPPDFDSNGIRKCEAS